MRRSVVRIAGLFAASVVSSSCAAFVQQRPDQIEAPKAYVSPNMDFTRIARLGVFPLFPGSNPMMGATPGGVQDDAFAEQMINALTGEIETRQSQWAISNYRDVIALINKSGLGSGFRNLQADLNTAAGFGMQGSIVMSPTTKKFMADMQRAAGVDAFLVGTYVLTREARVVGSLIAMTREVDVARVRWVLFNARDGQAWWNGEVGRYGDRPSVIKEIAQSLAANLGKGTLIQM